MRNSNGLLSRILKAVTNTAKYEEGTNSFIIQGGQNGSQPWPFDYTSAVFQCSGWVYRCAYGNSEAAASIPLRMYIKQKAGKKCLWTTKPVSKSKKNYLIGDARSGMPSNGAMVKAAQMQGDFVEVVDHPALRLLRTANPYLNGYDLSVYRFLAQELTGNAYMNPIMSGDKTAPIQLFPLMPQNMWIRRNNESGNFIDGYTYGQSPTEGVEYETDEVLHFKVTSPKNVFYGLGKVEACWDTLGINNSERIMQKALFDNQARPDAVISVEGASSDQLKAVNEKINNKHRGVRKSGKILATGGRTTFTPLQFSPKELGTTERIIEEIAGVFGYPVTKLLANDPNRANAETGDAGWMKDTIKPMITRDEQSLNQDGYLALWNHGALMDDAFFAYDDPVPDNQDRNISQNTAYAAAGIMTLNEVREKEGLEPVEGGDVPRINGMSIETLDTPAPDPSGGFGDLLGLALDPIKEQLKGLEPAKKTEPQSLEIHNHIEQKADGGGCSCGCGEESETKGVDDNGEEAAEDWHPTVKAVRKAIEDVSKEEVEADSAREGEKVAPAVKIARDVNKALDEAKRAVLSDLGASTEKALDDEMTEAQASKVSRKAIMAKLQKQLDEIFSRDLPPILASGANFGMERVGLDVESAFDISSPLVQAQASQTSELLSQVLTDTTNKELAAAMDRAIEQGMSVRRMAEEINSGHTFSTSRAVMIARSESARAFTDGQEAAWRESDVVQGKKILLATNACPFCRSVEKMVNKKTNPLGEPLLPDGTTVNAIDGSGTMTISNLSDASGIPIHPNCVLPGQEVEARGVVSAMRGWYDGLVYKIALANGRSLTCTRNHRIMTDGGFIAAEQISKGDNVVNRALSDMAAIDPDTDNSHPLIEDVFNSLSMPDGMSSASVPASPENFHGDGRFMDGDVDIVFADRKLRCIGESDIIKHGGELPLCFGWLDSVLPSLSDLDSMLYSMSLAAYSIIGSGGKALSFTGASVGHSCKHSLRPISLGMSASVEIFNNSASANTELLTDCLDRHSAVVESSEVVGVTVSRYIGHVYDLQTETGLYGCNGIITGNCRCDTIPVLIDELKHHQPTVKALASAQGEAKSILKKSLQKAYKEAKK